VHLLDEGDGPVLLLLHGNPTWSFLYRDMIPLLAPRFRCVAPDLPGMGLSSARDGYRFGPEEHREVLADLVAELDLTDITLVGQDWGGPIGMGAAVRDPGRYARIVLGNTWFWPFDDLRTSAFAWLMGGPLGAVAHSRLNLFVEQVIPRSHVRRTPGEREMAMWRGPYPTPASREPTHVFPRRITESAPYLADVAHQVETSGLADLPALVLHATKDPAFTAGVMRSAARRLHDSTLVELEGAGHYWQDDAPEDAVAALTSWFDEVTG
jgi:haloalkane dehalogenase